MPNQNEAKPEQIAQVSDYQAMMDQKITVLKSQRNNALDRCAELEGLGSALKLQINRKDEEIKSLQAKLKVLHESIDNDIKKDEAPPPGPPNTKLSSVKTEKATGKSPK